MGDFLFDTNGLQGTRRPFLETARAAGHRLLLSPISFWELACHLDEPDFGLARGNALKALLCDILHDPLAEMMLDVGCMEAVHPGRFEDQAGAIAILTELEQAQTYDDLMARSTSLDGRIQPIGDFAGRIREELDNDQVRFVAGMRDRCEKYVESYGRAVAMSLDDGEFCELATGLARDLVEDAAQAGCTASLDAMVDRTLLGAGYGVARASAYIRNVGPGQPLQIDGNDVEDYYIALHLGATSGRTFVTDDRGVRTALKRTFDAFQRSANLSGRPFARNVALMTTAEFKQAFPPPP